MRHVGVAFRYAARIFHRRLIAVFPAGALGEMVMPRATVGHDWLHVLAYTARIEVGASCRYLVVCRRSSTASRLFGQRCPGDLASGCAVSGRVAICELAVIPRCIARVRVRVVCRGSAAQVAISEGGMKQRQVHFLSKDLVSEGRREIMQGVVTRRCWGWG